MHRDQHPGSGRSSFHLFNKGFDLFFDGNFLRKPVRNAKIIPVGRDDQLGKVDGPQQPFGIAVDFEPGKVYAGQQDVRF